MPGTTNRHKGPIHSQYVWSELLNKNSFPNNPRTKLLAAIDTLGPGTSAQNKLHVQLEHDNAGYHKQAQGSNPLPIDVKWIGE